MSKRAWIDHTSSHMIHIRCSTSIDKLSYYVCKIKYFSHLNPDLVFLNQGTVPKSKNSKFIKFWISMISVSMISEWTCKQWVLRQFEVIWIFNESVFFDSQLIIITYNEERVLEFYLNDAWSPRLFYFFSFSRRKVVFIISIS